MVVVVMSTLRLLVIRFVVVVDLVTRWRGICGRGVVAHSRDPLLTVHVEGDRREVNTQRVMVPGIVADLKTFDFVTGPGPF